MRKTREIIRVSRPKKADIFVIRTLICMAFALMCAFLIWFIDSDLIGDPFIYTLLTFALIFKLVKMLHEWYHYWSPSVPDMPELKSKWSVDVLTTACPGEPRDMIIRTLKAMVAIRYPHTSYLCDEGDDPYLRSVCDELGVIHVTRTEKKDAKAGNINNALRQATGDICVVLDPDHVPVPEFLDRVLPYFEDPCIGFVQCVQGYGNQEESFIARGAAEQTYHFYGPMMMCMNTYGTVQAIGANCTFRRSALDSIGGHAAGLSEDMHTAMQIHAKGWKSVYIPEMLTRGLVPATLSSYYKQQLKWSRGTFELLFRTYPKLCRNFTWRQKLHYITLPMYFLYGLINMIDILVPVLALCFAAVPWEVQLGRFAALFVPMCLLSLVIRLYAQRWLLEKHERGFHLAGGTLRTATWWIFLIGFVYAIFNVKVPYIPTPKEDAHEDQWRLSLPNILIVLICSLAIAYGLHIDWSPYSIAMAGYAAINALVISCVVLMSQQQTIGRLRESVSRQRFLSAIVSGARWTLSSSAGVAYRMVRNGPMALAIALSMIFFGYTTLSDETEEETISDKKIGGFYFGTHAASDRFYTVQSCGMLSVKSSMQVDSALRTISGERMPFLRLSFPEQLRPSLLDSCASLFVQYRKPMFISLDDSAIRFTERWQNLYTYFNGRGVSNLSWVWVPRDLNSASEYPGPKFTDWIGCSFSKNTRFDTFYPAFRQAYGEYQKPVMLIEPFFHGTGGEGLRACLESVADRYREVKSLILSSSVAEREAREVIRDLLDEEHFAEDPLAGKLLAVESGPVQRHFSVQGSPGSFRFVVNGSPYYIKGVAYNTQHDWRDGNMPLTRRQLEKDFSLIRSMGANTLRRYDHGFYDRNILNIAQEFDLKVMYGFWFDPRTDFFKDSDRVNSYIDDVLSRVEKYKDHPSIIAWSLGNETWGLLKHHFSKPYLTLVRDQYVRLIETLAQKIHQIDPLHPVLTCIEHEEYQIAGELTAFRFGAPSVDVVGINSYYREQISKLNHICWEFNPDRPYIVSEFGPRGYWDPKYNRYDEGMLTEDSDQEKADWYKEQWNSYVSAFRGFNLGGFAYCWHDRMEGSYTWFGITDYKGRVKQSYYALKECWTGKKESQLPAMRILSSRNGPGNSMLLRLSGEIPEDYSVQWKLLGKDFREIDDNIEMVSPHEAKIKAPSGNNCRLYVFAANGKDVVTASAPISVLP